MGGIEIVRLQKEPNATGRLVPDCTALMLTVRTSQQDTGLGPRRPDDDPAFWTAVVGHRRRVLDEVEPQGGGEEFDGLIVVIHHDRDQGKLHPRESSGASLLRADAALRSLDSTRTGTVRPRASTMTEQGLSPGGYCKVPSS